MGDLRQKAVVLSVMAIIVLAGCAGPFGSEPTPTMSPTATATETPTPTPTPSDPTGSLPPGVGSDGLDNATMLLGAHVAELNATGFIGVGTGNGTVLREGFLIDVRSHQRNVMAPNAQAYRRNRTVVAGPIERRMEAWGNRSVEVRRSKENGQWSVSHGQPAPASQLAGRGLLLPYLQGGNYTLAERNDSDNESRHRLVATEVDDPEALRQALPDDVDRITSFQATVIVDEKGRIHSVEAMAEYEIQGQTATHHLEYTLEQVGGVSVEPPDWVQNR